MTGTLASRLMRSIRPLPPRGMITSTYCGMAISWPTASRSVVCTSCTASAGRPASTSACCTSRGQRLVRFDRLRAAAQDAGVAALDRQAGGLDGHVGPALEDHAEHADRHAHLADADAAGLLLHADDLADDVGHGGQLLAALGHGLDDLGRELEAVHHAARPGRPRRRARCPARWPPAAPRRWLRSRLASLRSAAFLIAASRARHRAEAALACKPRVCVYSAMSRPGCAGDEVSLSAFMPLFWHAPARRRLWRAAPRTRGTAASPAGAAPASRRPASRAASGP